jgi:hypothetical protein
MKHLYALAILFLCSIAVPETVMAVCPTFSNPTPGYPICAGITSSDISVDVSHNDVDVYFVYFTMPKTGNSMYSGGTPLGGPITPTGSMAPYTVSLNDITLPTTGGLYYIYAILDTEDPDLDSGCRPSAEIIVTVNEDPTSSNAGPDQSKCNSGTFSMAANAPTVGTGQWTLVSGTATIVNPNSRTTTVNDVPLGTSATLRWTISNGACSPSEDDVILTNNANPTTAAAGTDQSKCDNGTFILDGNVPSTGTGMWSVVSGTANIETPSSATSQVTGIAAGASATLRWTISNGACAVSTDDVILKNDAQPTTSNAGPDQSKCNNGTFSMAANAPTVGTGQWTLVSGTATIVNPNSRTTSVNGVPLGTSAMLRWTISNGACASSEDDVILTNNANPTTATAGTDQSKCNNGTFILDGNVPSIGTGMWSVVSGTANIETPSSATSQVTGIAAGASATLRWTISNGACPPSTDDVKLTNDALPTASNAGSDQSKCNSGTFTMAANTPSVGTGQWSVVSGTANPININSPTTNVNGVPVGTSATLRWTISNGTCPPSTDEVVITNYATPTTAAAGPDQAQCNNGAFTLAGNTPVNGTGLWNVVSGTATIVTPTSPISQVTGIAAGSSVTLRWTISNGPCTASTDDVILKNDLPPTTSNAGPDQAKCNSGTFNMSSNAPTVGTGLWTLISGTATILTPTSTTTTVNGVPLGTSATLRWTISNGTCTASTDDVVLSNDATPTPAAAGMDIGQCNNGTFTMAGSSPTIGTGLWTVQSGTATIATPSSPTSQVTNVALGASTTLRWTVTNGSCPVSTDDVVLTNDNGPSAANAGPDQSKCTTGTFTMAANAPTSGTGLWSIVAGTGSIANPSSPTTQVTGVPLGTSVTLRWTISSGSCTSNMDDVILTNSANPTTAAAGNDQAQCNNGTFTLAGNTPLIGSGLWMLVSGTATIVTPNSPTSQITGVATGSSVTLRWTISNNPCPASTDDVSLRNDQGPSASNAGPDQAKCNSGSFTMAANLPTTGTGQWSIVSGSCNIANQGSATTNVTGVASGSSVTLRWTISSGSCTASTDDVVLTNDASPTTANAGIDIVQCNNGAFTMAGNTPLIGTGQWTLISGSASIATSNSPTTQVTGVAAGAVAGLRWTISNGTCPSTSDDVSLKNDALPTSSNAGTNQAKCNNGNFTLAANAPAVGMGQWSVVSGTANLANPGSPTSSVTAVPVGSSATLRWTITNGSCPPSTDDVILTNDAIPSNSNAGLDQTLCNTGTFTLNGNTPSIGTGLWTVVTGTGNISNPGNAGSSVTGVGAGSSITLRWSISNGVCTTSTDDVILKNDALPSTANAGMDQTKCNTPTFSMAANTPSIGTGLWSVIAGSATIATPGSPTSTVNALLAGNSATLRWTISNGVCPASTDEVMLKNDAQPTTANAGVDQANCNDGSFTMAANTPSVGTGQWSLVPGGTANINNPSSPTTDVTGVPLGGSATLRWTIINGVCPANADDIILRNNTLPVASIAITENSGLSQTDNTVCSGGMVTLTASGASGGGSYLWDNGVTTSTRVVYPTISPLSSYSVTVTNAALCTSSVVKNVNVLNNPVSGYSAESGNVPTVAGLLTFYDNSSAGSGQITNWNWSFLPNGNPTIRNNTSNQSANTVPNATGPMNVQLIVIDNNKCSDTVSNQYVILANDQCGISAVNSPNSICENETVNFSANIILSPGQNSLMWFWTFGDGGTSSLANPTYTYTEPGTYTISVYFVQQINSMETCTTAVFTKQITVNPIPSGALFVDNTNQVYEICEGESFNLTINLNPSNSPYNVAVTGIGPINDIQSGYTTPLITQPPGTYTYTLQSITNNNTGCSNPNVNSSVTITVDAKPLITLTNRVCKPQDQIWLADISITKGKAPYTLTITGMSPVTITASTYNIVNIPVTTASIVVSVLDANGCTYQLTIDKPSCDCPNPGPITMTPVVKNICEGTSKFSVSAVNGIVNTDNLAVLYELYDAQTNQVLSSVNLTQFNIGPEFTSPANGIFSYDKEYYVRATVARNNGSGFPDLTDACKLNTTDLNTKVYFRRNPRIAISFSTPEICAGKDAKVFFTPNYASNAVKVTWNKNASGSLENTFTGLDSFNLVGFTSDITVKILNIKDQVYGCESTNSDEATLKVNPMPNSTISAPAICAGGTLNMSAGSTGNQYFWAKDGQPLPNISETIQLLNASVADFGVYSVKVTDGKGCTSVSSFDVNSDDIQSNPVPQIKASIDMPCVNQFNAEYDAHANSNPANTFIWTIEGGELLYQYDDYASVHWNSDPGTKKIIVEEKTPAGCTAKNEIVVTLNTDVAPDKAPVIYAPDLRLLVCTDNTADCYQWGTTTLEMPFKLSNPKKIEGEHNQSYYLASATDDPDDISGSTVKLFWVDIWNSTPCGTSSDDISACRTRCYYWWPTPPIIAVHDLGETTFNFIVYPNPAASKVSLEFISAGELNDAELLILNIDGKLIKREMFNLPSGPSSKQLDVHALSSGVYVLMIRDPHSGKIQRKSLIVQHN